MHILLSPAKRLKSQNIEIGEYSKPVFLKYSEQLISELKTKSIQQIKKLMNLSDELAELNFSRYHGWNVVHTTKNSKPAISLFFGDAYKSLNAQNLNPELLKVLNNRLLILSGLYGVLKPFDLIQEHRLEMGTKLENKMGINLYLFWKQLVTTEINSIETDIIINLASNEYFKVIDKKNLKAQIFTPVFKEEKAGKYKTIAIYAKRARGLMTKFIVENNITKTEHIKAFNYDNYTFSKSMSKGNELVFYR